MLNKIIIVLLVVTILAVGASGFFLYNQNETINSLTIQIAASQRENAAQIATVQSSLDSQHTSLNADIASIKTENVTSFTGLQNQIATNSLKFGNDIDAISSSVNALDIDNRLESRIDSSLAAVSDQIKYITPGLATGMIYAKVNPSIVQITDGTYTHGTGFLYDNNGHVITAAHVIESIHNVAVYNPNGTISQDIENISNVTVILPDGTISKASVVCCALKSDVAILKLDTATSLQSVTMAADDSIVPGDAVLTVGDPYDLTNSLTAGVVSQIHRFENIGTSIQERWMADLIQFDAAANPGNSGGPLFDADGNVVGMVVAGINPLFGSGVNFGVSTARIRKVADDFLKNGQSNFPYIGVFINNLTQDKAASLGLKTINGVIVVNVSSIVGATSGLLKDDIITAIGSTPINCPDDIFSYFAGQAKVGDTLTFHIKRGSQDMTINVKVSGMNDNYRWVSMVPDSGSNATPIPGI